MSLSYKVSDISKDLGITNKKVIELMESYNINLDKKHNTILEEKTVNLFFERLTNDNMVSDLESFLNQKTDFVKKSTDSDKKKVHKEVDANKIKQKIESKKNIKKPMASKREDVTILKLSNLGESNQIDETIENKKKVRHITTNVTDVDLDKYSDKYEKIIPSAKLNSDNIQKKQKLHQKSQNKMKNKKGNKSKISESEKLLRIQEMNKKKKQLEVSIPEEIVVNNLALLLKVSGADLIKKLISLGVMASLSQTIDFDTACIVAEEFGAKATKEVVVTIEERVIEDIEDNDKDLQERSPVVVVMGHVDHGKTSLLDCIRKKNVTSTEAGGITQHIGAYKVKHNSKNITFLDTPGHEAFTSMRARGASITDIAILVVAADDGIMPQTVEAINHAKAANVSIIVAINKIDKPNANLEKIKQELTEHDIVPEDWGGDVICVPVSAKTSENVDKLLEMIQILAEFKELKCNPNRLAKGIVIEAKIDKGRGPVASILVQNGTLRTGDFIIAGSCVGKVRVMVDENSNIINSAAPSTPVEITGLSGVPSAGDEINVVKDEKLAKILVEERKWKAKQEIFKSYERVTLDNFFSTIEQGDIKELPIIIKADVQGSVEAIKQSLEKINNEEARTKVIHGAVGSVNESDVMLAGASNAIIIAFNVKSETNAALISDKENIEVRFYTVIYDAIEDIEKAIKGMLTPKTREVVIGSVEVRMIYKISFVGTVAGCYVLDGKIVRNSKIRVIRDGKVIAEDSISALKRFKDDVKEVQKSYECGISLEKFNDIKESDILEAFIIEEYRD